MVFVLQLSAYNLWLIVTNAQVYAGVDVCKGALLLYSLLGFAKGFKALFSGCIEGRFSCVCRKYTEN